MTLLYKDNNNIEVDVIYDGPVDVVKCRTCFLIECLIQWWLVHKDVRTPPPFSPLQPFLACQFYNAIYIASVVKKNHFYVFNIRSMFLELSCAANGGQFLLCEVSGTVGVGARGASPSHV